MDLIRTDRNPTWGITQDRQALRVGIVDAQNGSLVGSKFVDLVKNDFRAQQGQLQLLNAQGQLVPRVSDFELLLSNNA
ncbi:hypothetical protein EBU99_14610 [bacterium]|nr:hypothetical protein [bacterium]